MDVRQQSPSRSHMTWRETRRFRLLTSLAIATSAARALPITGPINTRKTTSIVALPLARGDLSKPRMLQGGLRNMTTPADRTNVEADSRPDTRRPLNRPREVV
jgi:hypothetical protein